MVKLIVTDVDDTLVPEAGSVINPEYYEVIRECRKRDIIFGVASGRQKPCVRKLFEPVLDEIFILADNGTDIWSSQYQTSMKLPYELYTELIDDIHKLEGYSIMACKPDIAYFEYGHEKYFEHMKTYPYVGEYTDDMRGIKDICKISIWRPEGIDPDVERYMQEKWSDVMEVCMAGECFLDFMAKGCNKGKALSIMQGHYGIGREDTVAFGNADNDIPMLQNAAHSYAVAAASTRLKETASQVIGEMKDDAVLKKLREILSIAG